MKYAIAASLMALVLLAACAPAAPKETPIRDTIVVQEKSGAAVETSDVEAVTIQVEEINNDMGLDDLDELDAQLADLDKLEIG